MANKRLCFNSRDESDNSDRISELPVDIFHQILSHLPAKDVARKSILSKTCLQAWQSYPVLDFSQSHFGKELPQQVGFWNCNAIVKGNPQAERSLEKFIAFVDRSIGNFIDKDLPLKRFKLFISLIDPESFRRMEKWIRLALNNRVEELDLSFGYRDPKRYILPQIVYQGAAAMSLKALSLCNCKVSLHLSTVLKLSSVRKLHLKNVKFDKHTMHRLINGCPYTEDLLLGFINGREIIDLSGLKYLKSVEVTSVSKSGQLLIESLSLEKLHCRHIQSLVFLKVSSALRDVYFSSVDITDLCFHKLIADSPRIESLAITSCSNLKELNVSSDSLLKFEICGCNNLKIDVHALNLRHFSYNGELLLSSFRLTSPLCSASLYSFSYFADEWLELLSNPVHSMRLRLHVSRSPQVRELRRLDANSIPTKWKVEHLELVAMNKEWKHNALAGFLVGKCRPKTLSMKYEGRGQRYASTFNFNSAPDAPSTISGKGEKSTRKLRSRPSSSGL